MSILTLDTNTTALYWQMNVPLEGAEYICQFFWSDRESRWYVSIFDQDDNPLCVGIAVVVQWSLLRRFAANRNAPAGAVFDTGVTVPRSPPPGVLIAVDMSGQNAEVATPTDLGTRVLLMYITSDDASLAGINLANL